MKRGPTVPPGGPPGVRWAPTEPLRARGDAVACPGGPYINRAPIRTSRAIRRAPSGPVVPKQCSDGNPSERCLGPTGPDEPRRITRLSRIGVRLIYGPIRNHTGP